MMEFVLYADRVEDKWQAHTEEFGRATTECDSLDELVRQVWKAIPAKLAGVQVVMILPHEEDANIVFLKPDVL